MKAAGKEWGHVLDNSELINATNCETSVSVSVHPLRLKGKELEGLLLNFGGTKQRG